MIRRVRFQRSILVCCALAFLVARALGLHFHQPAPHDHDAGEIQLAVPDHATGNHAALHQQGDSDLDAPLAAVAKSPLSLFLLAGSALLAGLLPVPSGSLRLRVSWRPLRPPRGKRRSLLLPPSQGPPAPAHIR